MHHSYLSGADFSACDLSNANLSKAHLEDTMINESVLDGVDLQFALFDGHSLLLPSRWNLLTNVIGSNFASARSYPHIRQSLEYNVRRRMWDLWYKRNPKKALFVRLFWSMSDYGNSFTRIFVAFATCAILFSVVYFLFGVYGKDGGIINGLSQIHSHGTNESSQEEKLSVAFLSIRAMYFSIVTMTTLGFGDMHPRDSSVLGKITVMIQVCFGYLILAALVTRLAVLVASSNGPSD